MLKFFIFVFTGLVLELAWQGWLFSKFEFDFSLVLLFSFFWWVSIKNFQSILLFLATTVLVIGLTTSFTPVVVSVIPAFLLTIFTLQYIFGKSISDGLLALFGSVLAHIYFIFISSLLSILVYSGLGIGLVFGTKVFWYDVIYGLIFASFFGCLFLFFKRESRTH